MLLPLPAPPPVIVSGWPAVLLTAKPVPASVMLVTPPIEPALVMPVPLLLMPPVRLLMPLVVLSAVTFRESVRVPPVTFTDGVANAPVPPVTVKPVVPPAEVIATLPRSMTVWSPAAPTVAIPFRPSRVIVFAATVPTVTV